MSHLSALAIISMCFALGACGSDDLELASASDVGKSTQPQFTAQGLFTHLKAVEANFPLPDTASLVDVGTLDPATGVWDGLQTRYYYVIDPITHKPRRRTDPARVDIDGIRALLSFECQGRTSQTFTVRIDGAIHHVPAGESAWTIDVGRDRSVSFMVSCGTKSFADTLTIGRPHAYGAGAFEIPIFPQTLLYEPPTNQARTNYAGYTTVNQRSSTTTLSRSTEKSDARPVFSGLSTITGRLLEVKDFLVKGSGPSVAIDALDLATNLVGTTKTDVQNGTTTQTEHTLELTTTETLGMKTNAHLGPGLGDIVGYLKRARFAWTMVEGQVELTLIDYDETAFSFVSDLLDDLEALDASRGTVGPTTGLLRDDLILLLELDPFALGDWQADRFEYKATIQPAGDITVGLSQTYSATDRTVETTSTARVTEAHAGWLSAIGLGVTESGKFKTTITESQSRKSTVGSTVTATFLLSAQPGEVYSVDCYFDKVFGTFAFQKKSFVEAPVFGGGVFAP